MWEGKIQWLRRGQINPEAEVALTPFDSVRIIIIIIIVDVASKLVPRSKIESMFAHSENIVIPTTARNYVVINT